MPSSLGAFSSDEAMSCSWCPWLSNTCSAEKQLVSGNVRAADVGAQRHHLFDLDQAAVAHGAHEHPFLGSQSLHGANDGLCNNNA